MKRPMDNRHYAEKTLMIRRQVRETFEAVHTP
jgi:hypothetical protein